MHSIIDPSKLGDPNYPPKLKFKYPQNTYSITISQQSFPSLNTQYLFPIVDVSQKFEESLEKCRKKHRKHEMKIKAIEKVTISRQMSDNIIDSYRKSQTDRNNTRLRCASESVETNEMVGLRNNRRASELVDQLLLDIYGRTIGTGSSERIFETEYGSSTSFRSVTDKFDEKLQYGRLVLKDVTELSILIGALRERVSYSGSLLVKQLKKRDALKSKQEKICNVITAHLHAYSDKRCEDTNMRFSPNPIPGDSGFNQWRDAMKMVAKLPGGIPPEFRRKLWIALAEKHLQSKGVNWAQTEKLCFNEWSNPDDSELGIQIVKDLHRTGCSLFCGAAGQENQALLKRVLLAYARWNKTVGYCQGFNMLAALILQVMDKNETDSVKVMIYLIEGVLPESYFANNLRGLSVDMIVFRDLLKMRLPLLSKHLEALQNDAREGNSYEPPLTNVFTMQWFLTLFCNCLPQPTVLRVWDLIFLEGNEILLRTAIAIWEKLSDRILAVNSADEFYSIMGVLTREMLEFGLVDSNTLVKSIVAIGTCSELNDMRDKYLYNITPWTQSVQTAAKKGFKLFYSDDDEVESDYDEKAAVTAAYGISIGRRRDKQQSNTREGTVIQPYAHGHPDRERLALDISALKKQYAKLRERQRQAHIILQAACARQPMGQNSTTPPIAMNHLLLGKSAIVNSRGRRLGPPKGSIPPARTKEPVKKKEPVPSGETIQWKDTAKFRRRQSCTEESVTASEETIVPESDSSSYSEDDDTSSTSTELCDEPGRMSDFENSSDDKFSDILESKRTVKSIKHNLQVETLATDNAVVPTDAAESTKSLGEFTCSEMVEMQSEFREIISDIEELKTIETDELLDLKTSEFKSSDLNDIKLEELVEIANKPIDVKDNLKILSDTSSILEPIIDETLVKFDDLPSSNTVKNEDLSLNIVSTTDNNEEMIVKEDEDVFETFLQERFKILKENSSDSLTSPKEEINSWRSSEEKLRRHKSYDETSTNHLEKSVLFKQQSFDISTLPTIETSLWKPYQIEEESPREEIEDQLVKSIEETDRPKEINKQASVDLLQVEDKRLEAGRRNSERALKIIQENSLILHRILQQQKSSEKEDSEDELSRSPISKTFMRSESLLSKDEKTDEERSSKDGDDELESGVESFSVSPALLDEESDRSMKKDQFEDQDETLIISKNEDTISNEYSYKYQSSDNTSNIISSSIFEDSSATKNEESNIVSKDLQMDISPITHSKSFEDYSPNAFEDSAKFDIASNILDYSKDNEDNSSSSIKSDNKFTVEKYSNIEERSVEHHTDSTIEDSPYRFSFKYKEESEDNIKVSSTVNEDTNQEKDDRHEQLLSFLSTSPKLSSSQTNNEDLMFEEKSQEITNSKYSDDFMSYLKNPEDKWQIDASSSTKEESKSYLQDTKEDMLSFNIPEEEYSKEDISSFSFSKPAEHSSPYKYRFREDSDDNIKDKYSSYLQNEEPASSSKYYRSTSPIDDSDKLSSLYKKDTTPKLVCEESLDSLDKFSSLYKKDTTPKQICVDSLDNLDKFSSLYKKDTTPKQVCEETLDSLDKFSSLYKEDTTPNPICEEKQTSLESLDTFSSIYKKDTTPQTVCEENLNSLDKFSSLYKEDTTSNPICEEKQTSLDSLGTFSSLYKKDSTPKQVCEETLDSLDRFSSLYKEDTTPNPTCEEKQSSSTFNYSSKYTLDSPEYNTSKSSIYNQDYASSSDKAKPEVNDIIDNKSPEYQYNKNTLTIELVPTEYGEYSPEISPPKHLSCLQFTDIPCTSKSIQFSPICTKEKQNISSQKDSPNKSSSSYFSTFKLPTLSPPRRSVKSPISPNKTFSPFPVQPTTRQPKELGVKLGMYKEINPLKSPNK